MGREVDAFAGAVSAASSGGELTNLDGGSADSVYGGTTAIDGGSA